jgi:hypothetical protein
MGLTLEPFRLTLEPWRLPWSHGVHPEAMEAHPGVVEECILVIYCNLFVRIVIFSNNICGASITAKPLFGG